MITHVTAFPEKEKAPLLAARIHWEPTDAAAGKYTKALYTRHTNRHFPWRQVPLEAYNRLVDLGNNLDGAAIWPVPRGDSRRLALKVIRMAEALRFSSRRLHAEMFGSVRFDLDWQNGGERGLAPGALAIERPLRPLFKMLRHWPAMRVLNLVGGAQIMALRSAVLPVLCSPALFVLTARSLERQDILQAGRLLQRFWLQAEVEGLAMQPFAAAGVLAHGRVALERRLVHRQARVQQHMTALTGADRSGLVFVRLGQPRGAPGLRSGRQSLATSSRSETV